MAACEARHYSAGRALNGMGCFGLCGSMWVPILYIMSANLRSVYLTVRDE